MYFNGSRTTCQLFQFRMSVSHIIIGFRFTDIFNSDLDLMDECLDICTNDVILCTTECDGDVECASICNRNKLSCDNECPCVSGECYDGCDNCPHTLCESNSMLILHDTSQWSKMYLFDTVSRTYSDIALEYDENTKFSQSCAITYKNTMYIIGGKGDDRQVNRFFLF